VFEAASRAELRQRYLTAWRKFVAKAPLEPLEQALAAVIALHPEYVPDLEAGDAALRADYGGAEGRENPFLHMGLHLALGEQLATDRPAGIAAEYQRLLGRERDAHATEHRLMQVLAEVLWEAQARGGAPDERLYLARLRRL
jgi:hypothetical protein